MRFREVVIEVVRDARSGAARWTLFFLAATCAIAALATIDALSVGGIYRESRAFHSVGADVRIIQTDAGVNGRWCQALGSAVVGDSGAVRREEDPLVFLALPNSKVPLYSGTSDILAVLVGTEGRWDEGLLLSEALASDLDIGPGATVNTYSGPAHVAAVFAYPDDGRQTSLEYAAIQLASNDQSFQECWTRTPLSSKVVAAIAATVVSPNASQESRVSTTQLNETVGRDVDPEAEFRSRPTALLVYAALLIGTVLGAASVRMRTLEFAADLHAGLDRGALALRNSLLTLAWSLPAAAAGTAIVMGVNSFFPDLFDAFVRTATGAGGFVAVALLAAAASSFSISERRMFSYFKKHR